MESCWRPVRMQEMQLQGEQAVSRVAEPSHDEEGMVSTGIMWTVVSGSRSICQHFTLSSSCLTLIQMQETSVYTLEALYAICNDNP